MDANAVDATDLETASFGADSATSRGDEIARAKAARLGSVSPTTLDTRSVVFARLSRIVADAVAVANDRRDHVVHAAKRAVRFGA